jgi:hypothetical protein
VQTVGGDVHDAPIHSYSRKGGILELNCFLIICSRRFRRLHRLLIVANQSVNIEVDDS